MNLRQTIFLLALLTIFSVSAGGYFYYASLKESVTIEAERQTSTRAELIRKNLSSFLSENIRPIKTLAGMKALQTSLIEPDDDFLEKANAVLDHFRITLGGDVC